ncbi:MAG: transposase [Prevotella sp.]|nr:transposase [Prevotella sp.]
MLRGINRQDIFEAAEDYSQFLRILHAITNRKDDKGTPLQPLCTIYAYCLMSNHVHLLIRERLESIGESIKRIGVAYARYYNNKYERNGHLFQDRFKSEPVESIEYFFTLMRYIHQNPVKSGLTVEVRDYPWSSWHEYEGTHTAFQICETASVIRRLDRQDLYEFITMPTEDNILDFHDEGKNTFTDEEVKKHILEICGLEVPTDIQKLDKRERNSILKRLCEYGITIRQISRITGISYGVINRAKNGS